MGLFGIGKRKEPKVTFVKNKVGDEIHIFNGVHGEMRIKKLDTSIWLATGNQFCPDCHHQIVHKDGYWECSICQWSITDAEVSEGDGYPTLESTYEDDYKEYYEENLDDKPEGCSSCGGPWPHCETSCKIFDD